MTDVIRLLPDAVANQIAAGEVIQRPSSAIKELVENAVDSGATDVRIVVKDAGKTMIQVIDNGSGMSETDARMALRDMPLPRFAMRKTCSRYIQWASGARRCLRYAPYLRWMSEPEERVTSSAHIL